MSNADDRGLRADGLDIEERNREKLKKKRKQANSYWIRRRDLFLLLGDFLDSLLDSLLGDLLLRSHVRHLADLLII